VLSLIRDCDLDADAHLSTILNTASDAKRARGRGQVPRQARGSIAAGSARGNGRSADFVPSLGCNAVQLSEADASQAWKSNRLSRIGSALPV
jgi:hypothetical protein